MVRSTNKDFMRSVLIVLIAGVLAGCELPQQNVPVARSETPREEVYTHTPSGFKFPWQIKGFFRLTVTPYDQRGENVGIAYNDVANSIAGTVFIYPVPQSDPHRELQGHFAALKGEMMAVHPKAKLIEEGTAEIAPAGRVRKGLRAIYTLTRCSHSGGRMCWRNCICFWTARVT
jgi:hypothetical protein